MSFIRIKKKKKSGLIYSYRVRSQREGKKVRQIHEAYLGAGDLRPKKVGTTTDDPGCELNDGLAKQKRITKKDVDQEQLKTGVKIEMEHTKDKKLRNR